MIIMPAIDSMVTHLLSARVHPRVRPHPALVGAVIALFILLRRNLDTLQTLIDRQRPQGSGGDQSDVRRSGIVVVGVVARLNYSRGTEVHRRGRSHRALALAYSCFTCVRVDPPVLIEILLASSIFIVVIIWILISITNASFVMRGKCGCEIVDDDAGLILALLAALLVSVTDADLLKAREPLHALCRLIAVRA